jgi:hypothetical protein
MKHQYAEENRIDFGPVVSVHRLIGKLAECSDANAGSRALCPNIQPKHVCPKIRTQFPYADSSDNNTSFFRRKMHDRFPPLVLHLPLQKRDGANEFLYVRTLSSICDHWGKFVRTFSAITTHTSGGKCPEK